MTSEAHDLAQHLRLSVDRLRRIVRNRRSLDGIPRAQEAVLGWIERKGALTIADLARWEQVRPQSMGVVVSEMVNAGLVDKSPDPTDGRRELLSLTERGMVARVSIAASRDADLAALMNSRLSEEERAVVGRALELFDRLGADSDDVAR